MEQIALQRIVGLATHFFFVVAIIALGATAATACAICLSGMKITVGQKLDSADEAVLAVPLAAPGTFRIVEVIKGDLRSGDALPLTAKQPQENSKPFLVLRYPLSEQWESQGQIDLSYADWLRQIAVDAHGLSAQKKGSLDLSPVRKTLTEEQWTERLGVVVGKLESADPLAAEIAYGEISRAPYATLRSLKTRLDADRIAIWLDDPKLSLRRSAYTLLLGIAGRPDDANRLEQQLDRALASNDADNLAAMLAADLELRGSARVTWIEQMYFANRGRILPEIEAALLALSVQGGVNGVVPRERVIQAYRSFIKLRKPMAGFVAMELADWGAWEATDDYVDILASKAVKDPAGEFAILSYLHRSPVASQLAVLPDQQSD